MSMGSPVSESFMTIPASSALTPTTQSPTILHDHSERHVISQGSREEGGSGASYRAVHMLAPQCLVR